MIDKNKWNIDYIGEKIIKPMYEDSIIPLTLADEIKEAIEKQIPKKPINVDSMYIPELMADRVYGECHKCGKYVSEIAKYCCECGQATDWEETHEGEEAKKAAAGKEE